MTLVCVSECLEDIHLLNSGSRKIIIPAAPHGLETSMQLYRSHWDRENKNVPPNAVGNDCLWFFLAIIL